MSALDLGTGVGMGVGRWESAFGFKKKILRFIERFEALCQHPVPGDPELHPFARLDQIRLYSPIAKKQQQIA